MRVDAAPSRSHEGTSIVCYDWEFGDGTGAQGVAASHTYTRSGRFTIRLLIEDDLGLRSIASRAVTVLLRSGDVSPWSAVDIGDPPILGKSRFDAECLSTFSPSEGSIWGTSDQFHFVYQKLNGDITITARAVELPSLGWGYSTQVVLMLRESLEPGARHVAMIKGGNHATVRYRRVVDDPAEQSRAGPFSGWVRIQGSWMRIQRRGDTFIGSSSTDGVTWTQVGRTRLRLPETLLAGVGATGVFYYRTWRTQEVAVQLCDLEVTGEPATPFLRGDCNADGKVDIADGVYTLSFLFLGAEAPLCPDAADTDDSGAIDITDGLAIFNHLFTDGDAPPMPGPWVCGPDPTRDELGCGEFAACR